MQYTTNDFIAAIDRELKLRRTTYPKIVEKKQKQWEEQRENVMLLTIELTVAQRIQFELLQECHTNLTFAGTSPNAMVENFRELQRELRMRKSCYPRWVRLGRMAPETATMEIAVWEALTKYYQEAYCPDASWRKPPIRHG